jgi:Fe-S oxidoreductase
MNKDNYYKCDFCKTQNKTVVAGNWHFYCPKHKKEEFKKVWENETRNGETFDDLDGDSEVLISEFL